MSAYGNDPLTIFRCLVAQDTTTLQQASAKISGSGTFGTWGFLPVTDGILIQSTPSQALLQRKVNGLNHLSGSNAEEGLVLTTSNITTENDLLTWIRLVFPLFKDDDIAKLLYYYPSSNASDATTNLTAFATSGDEGPTALNISQRATGQQQRAANIYGYQYSVPNAAHGSDITAYFGMPTLNQGRDLVLAFQRIWGNFVKSGNPSISAEFAGGTRANRTAISGALEQWPVFAMWDRRMANLNQTAVEDGQDCGDHREPGLMNDFMLVDAYEWEGGRGLRCDFWKSVSNLVPE
jgi:carboxylesterase type B